MKIQYLAYSCRIQLFFYAGLLYGTGTNPIYGGTQRRGFSCDHGKRTIGDTMIIAALAQKLGLGVLLEELFEFAIHRARTVEISASAHTIARVPISSSVQIPTKRICS